MSDWREQAECRDHDHDLWFPERGEAAHQAKAICRACPVREECLQDALRTGERHGVRGGFTATEREGMRPSQRELGNVCGTNAGYARHLRAGTPPCRGCLWAHADYKRCTKNRQRAS